MSQENVDTTRIGVVAMAQGDVEAIVQLVDPAVEYVSYLVGVEGTSYHGHEGLRSYFRDLADAWEAFEVQIDEYRDVGNDVVAIGDLQAKGRASGAILESRLAWVISFREGTGPNRVTSMRFYTDPEQALEAVGLRE